jgi:flagellar biosynthesis protein FlhG
MGDQADSLRQAAGRHLAEQRAALGRHGCRVLAVTSGKGGVGKTNVAVNLSLALCEGGAKVLLLDGDLGLANVDLLLGLKPQRTLQHVFSRQATLNEVLLDGPLGLKILPGALGLPELANLGTLDIVRLLGLLRGLEREHDVLVIDTAAGISRLVTQFALAADDVIIVSMPEPTALVDAYGLMKALSGGEVQGGLHLLVNMVSRRGDEQQFYRSLASVAESYLGLGLNWLGTLYRDDEISTCVKRHQPFYLARPRSAASAELRRIAGVFLALIKLDKPPRDEGFFSRLLNSMR